MLAIETGIVFSEEVPMLAPEMSMKSTSGYEIDKSVVWWHKTCFVVVFIAEVND